MPLLGWSREAKKRSGGIALKISLYFQGRLLVNVVKGGATWEFDCGATVEDVGTELMDRPPDYCR